MTSVLQLAIETIDDHFGPRGRPGLVPYYDIVDVSTAHDIVCVRPNKLPRADMPDSVFMVNCVIMKDTGANT